MTTPLSETPLKVTSVKMNQIHSFPHHQILLQLKMIFRPLRGSSWTNPWIWVLSTVLALIWTTLYVNTFLQNLTSSASTLPNSGFWRKKIILRQLQPYITIHSLLSGIKVVKTSFCNYCHLEDFGLTSCMETCWRSTNLAMSCKHFMDSERFLKLR